MAGSVGKKASALVASDPDKKRLAEKSFTSYVRAIQLMPNKQVHRYQKAGAELMLHLFVDFPWKIRVRHNSTRGTGWIWRTYLHLAFVYHQSAALSLNLDFCGRSGITSAGTDLTFTKKCIQ